MPCNETHNGEQSDIDQFSIADWNIQSENQFKNDAKTGDILLLRSSVQQLIQDNNSNSTKTKKENSEERSGDRLNFDQVALIIKFKADPDETYFLEAVPEQARSKTQPQRKIRLNRWGQLSNFIGSNKIYDLVAWRKVIFSRHVEARKI